MLASGGTRATATGTVATAIARALEASGIDGRQLAREAGVSEQTFESRDTRIDCSTLDRLVAMAAQACGNVAFVKAAAQHVPVVCHHLYFAMLASETGEDALRRAVRFRRVLSDEFDISLQVRGAYTGARFEAPEPRENPWVPSDWAAMGISTMGRALQLSPEECPSIVELRRPDPKDPSHLQDVLQCPIRYGMPTNEIFWPTSRMQERLPLANPQMVLDAERAVIDYLARIDQSRFEHRVRGVLMDSLPSATHERRRIAQKLGVSLRTLSRALAEEGTSYRDILEEVREILARSYLRDSTSTIGEIALRLGFSDTSAFSRAFRRWTDQAPTEYADRCVADADPASPLT